MSWQCYVYQVFIIQPENRWHFVHSKTKFLNSDPELVVFFASCAVNYKSRDAETDVLRVCQ